MGKSELCGTTVPLQCGFVLSALRTSEGVPLLWSLFCPHILRVPPNLLLSPGDHRGRLRS